MSPWLAPPSGCFLPADWLLLFQDMEISAYELQTIMNKIVAKREPTLRHVQHAAL